MIAKSLLILLIKQKIKAYFWIKKKKNLSSYKKISRIKKEKCKLFQQIKMCIFRSLNRLKKHRNNNKISLILT